MLSIIVTRLNPFIMAAIKYLLSLLVVISLLGCSKVEEKTQDLLLDIKDQGILKVLVTNEPTSYFIDRDGMPSGPEHDMALAFAKFLEVEPKFIVKDSVEAVINSLEQGEGHLAGAGLTITSERKKKFDFGPSYTNVSEYLVCHRSSPKVKSAEHMQELEIVVPAATSYIDTLEKSFPGVPYQVDKKNLTPVLLKKVRDKKIQCTISDSTVFNINRRYFPEISRRYTLRKDSKLAAMFAKGNPKFKQAFSTWFGQYKKSGELAKKNEKYYGHIEAFDYVDVKKFKKRISSRLPKYRDWFINAAEQYDLSPSLLAAQSYQESHWNPKAKSPTGVRGIMMLTQPVAKSMGVTSRLDPEQNIYAGARFKAKMKGMFDEVDEPDKTWLALAAYNVGRGHFRDAQSLARKLGKNPELWLDMKEVLPLLSDKNYYKDLKYGYARGSEPVQYVSRIREYHVILAGYF